MTLASVLFVLSTEGILLKLLCTMPEELRSIDFEIYLMLSHDALELKVVLFFGMKSFASIFTCFGFMSNCLFVRYSLY